MLVPRYTRNFYFFKKKKHYIFYSIQFFRRFLVIYPRCKNTPVFKYSDISECRTFSVTDFPPSIWRWPFTEEVYFLNSPRVNIILLMIINKPLIQKFSLRTFMGRWTNLDDIYTWRLTIVIRIREKKVSVNLGIQPPKARVYCLGSLKLNICLRIIGNKVGTKYTIVITIAFFFRGNSTQINL